MKKSAFLSIVCTLFVLTALTSCSMSPDMMLKQYNDKLYEDIGGGVFLNPNGASVNTKLIPRDVYPVKLAYTLRLEISSAYSNYSWSVKDNTTGHVYNIPGYYIVYVGRPEIDFQEDHDYTLTVFLKNRNGVLFTDTATLKVVK